MLIYDQSAFPPMFASSADKSKYSYGLQVAQAVLGSTSQWRETFRKQLFENRKYAEGKQDVTHYLQELDIDVKDMYTNISYKARPIAQSFIRAVVGGYNMRNEYPNVTALSKYIANRKQEKKDKAAFRMENPELIQQLSQQVGFPVEDPNAFTPTDQEELDLHFQLNDKEKEELMMQEMVTFALQDNDIEQLKNDCLYEQFVAQFHGYYNYIDGNGRLCIEFIQAEDIITDNSFKENFEDASYKGRFLRMNIADIRRKFNIKPEDEKKLYDAAKQCVGKYNNSNRFCDWTLDYRYSDVRPYDNYTVEIAHIWYKTAKVLKYVEGSDRYGRTVFDTDYKIADDTTKSDGRKKVDYKYPLTAYEGFFTADGGLCLEWGEQRNILRAGEDKQELLCPFIFNMPENKGRMLPNSLMAMIIDSIRAMDLAILKIKQVIAKATPDDYIIDIDALMGIDLGQGELSPLSVTDIFHQTGRLYYRGRKEDGTENNIPVRSQIGQFEQKIQAFINEYNFELGNIRGYLGVNEFRDGSSTNPRTGFKFMQAQNQASNTITWFLYRAYVKSTEELLKQIGIRIWDALLYGKVNEGYQKYLGKKNIEWLQSKKEITSSSYDIQFSLGLSDEDKVTLENYINTALQNQSITIADALMIGRVKDPVIAERLLTYLFNKRSKEKEQSVMANQKANADLSTQTAVATEQAKQQTVAAQIEAEKEKTIAKGEQERDLAMEKLAWDLILNEQTTGRPIPPRYQALVDSVLQNRGLNVIHQTDEKEQMLEAQAMQQEQALVQQDQEMFLEELQAAVQNGEISEEEAQTQLQQMGM